MRDSSSSSGQAARAAARRAFDFDRIVIAPSDSDCRAMYAPSQFHIGFENVVDVKVDQLIEIEALRLLELRRDRGFRTKSSRTSKKLRQPIENRFTADQGIAAELDEVPQVCTTALTGTSGAD